MIVVLYNVRGLFMKKKALILILTFIFAVILCGAVNAASNESIVSIQKTNTVFASAADYLVVSSLKNEGVKYDVQSTGEYKLSYEAGAWNRWDDTTSTIEERNSYESDMFIYLNRPATFEQGSQTYREPNDPDYSMGNRFYDGYNAAEEAGKKSTPIYLNLKKGDYLTFLCPDQDDWFFDNDGSITIKISQTSSLSPVANAGPDQNVYVGDMVSLDGSKSTPSKEITKYYWKIIKKPNGSTAFLSGTSPSKPKFKADKIGEYVVQLIVENRNGVKSKSDAVKIYCKSNIEFTLRSAPRSVSIKSAKSLPRIFYRISLKNLSKTNVSLVKVTFVSDTNIKQLHYSFDCKNWKEWFGSVTFKEIKAGKNLSFFVLGTVAPKNHINSIKNTVNVFCGSIGYNNSQTIFTTVNWPTLPINIDPLNLSPWVKPYTMPHDWYPPELP